MREKIDKFYMFIRILIYIISPGSYLVSKYNLKEETIMLFRMTINITYYTAIIAILFIIEYS